MTTFATPHVLVVSTDGEITDVTEHVETVFRRMGSWPLDWEEYVGDEVLAALWSVASTLQVERAEERLAKALAEIEAAARRKAEIEEQSARYRAQQAKRREAQLAEATQVLEHLGSILPTLATRTKESGR